MNIVGIDPGVSGALALIVDSELTDVIDTPSIDKRVNVAVVAEWFRDWQHSVGPIDLCFIENVHSMPGNSGRSMFAFGRALGNVEAVPQSRGLAVRYIQPASWKRSMGLIGKPKGASRQLATDFYPTWAAMFKRVKDDGRAEATLIARHGEETT